VLTADHGVAPTPEFATEQGFDELRLDTAPLLADLQTQLVQRFGEAKFFLWPRLVDGHLYLNREALWAAKVNADDVAVFVREWALATGKFQAAYTRSQLLDGRAPGVLGRRILNGYNAERSGDVVLVTKPYTLSVTVKSGTTHGSPFGYDSHIPVLFFGSAFKPGRYADEFYITDIAPTLCAALRINEPPGATGKPFVKVLADNP